MAYTTIDNPELYFQVQLYTGNGSADHAITLGGDENMQPDFVIIKNRDATDNWCVFDSVRGVGLHLAINTNAESENTDADTLDAFQSDGFRVDADVKVNTNTEKYVAYCWKAGTTSGITTNGSTTITPSGYSFNHDAGISIIKYAGNDTAGAKVAHGLGTTPSIIFTRNRDNNFSWQNYHHKSSASPQNNSMYLNHNFTLDSNLYYWNNTAPDAVNFTVGNNGTSNDSDDYVAYSFVEKQGYSKFGTYEGNGAADDGTFVFLGFRPAFVWIKNIDTDGADWNLWDNRRPGYNPNYYLPTNENEVEVTTDEFDFLSNGFKARENDNDQNQSAKTIAYMAFAEAPFVNSSGVPCNAR